MKRAVFLIINVSFHLLSCAQSACYLLGRNQKSRHFGSNRAVLDEKGEILQLVHYYPFGGIFADAGISREAQEYLFCGKEREPMHGLDTYDFGARQYYNALPLWDRMDPLCEKSPELSPYVYCNDNPINRLDKNGKDSYLIVWASQNDTYGHASIGVDNYKYNVLTNKMEKDGTISTFGLFPYGNYNGKDAILDKKVRGLFFVDSKTKNDDKVCTLLDKGDDPSTCML